MTGMVKEQKAAFQAEYHRRNVTGTLLCILSVLPLFLSACVQGADFLYIGAMSLMLVIVGVGCYAFVYAGTRQGAMERLLQEGEYSEKKKEGKKLRGTISSAYWLIVTATFLYYTFGPQGNAQPQYSWFIWAIAGVIYGALMCLWNILEDQGRK